jgi:hypothetical protein
MKITQRSAIVLTALGLMVFLTSCTTPQSAETKSAGAASSPPPTRRLPLDNMSNPCVCDCTNLIKNEGFEDFIINTCPGSHSDENHIHVFDNGAIGLPWEISPPLRTAPNDPHNGVVSLVANAGTANEAINVPSSIAASFFNTPHGNQFAVIGHHDPESVAQPFPVTQLRQEIATQLKGNTTYQISFYQSAATGSLGLATLGGEVTVRVFNTASKLNVFPAATMANPTPAASTNTVLAGQHCTKQCTNFTMNPGPPVTCTIEFEDVKGSVAIIDNVVLCEVPAP